MQDKNVLFILTDQWRTDSIGYMGNETVKTPNMDQLFTISHSFDNSHTITPLCSPARGCLLTGLAPHENGVRDNMNVGASNQQPLGVEQRTWLKAAAERGMQTAYFGKWHLGTWEPETYGVTFDTFSNELTVPRRQLWARATQTGELVEDAAKRDKEAWGRLGNHEGDKFPYYGLRDDGTTTPDYYTADGAIDFLNHTDKDSAWCVTASFKAPHFPLMIPEPFYSMYDYKDMILPANLNDRFINKPWFQNRHWWPTMNTDRLTDEDWQKTIAAYYGLISYVDDLIGKVIEAARKNSNGRETICIFTADHGEMLGAHSRFDKGAYFYEEVMRTPLLVCEDLNATDAVVSRHQSVYCSTKDVATTLFKAVGDEGGKGRDLMAVVQETSEDTWPDEAFGAYYRYNGHSFEVRTIATPRYKYSYVPQDVDELYDLQEDPYELYNLSDSDDYREVKQQLKERLFEHMQLEKDYLLDENRQLMLAGEVEV